MSAMEAEKASGTPEAGAAADGVSAMEGERGEGGYAAGGVLHVAEDQLEAVIEQHRVSVVYLVLKPQQLSFKSAGCACSGGGVAQRDGSPSIRSGPFAICLAASSSSGGSSSTTTTGTTNSTTSSNSRQPMCKLSHGGERALLVVVAQPRVRRLELALVEVVLRLLRGSGQLETETEAEAEAEEEDEEEVEEEEEKEQEKQEEEEEQQQQVGSYPVMRPHKLLCDRGIRPSPSSMSSDIKCDSGSGREQVPSNTILLASLCHSPNVFYKCCTFGECQRAKLPEGNGRG